MHIVREVLLDPGVLLLTYLVVCAVILIIVLFGETAFFQNTPVAYCHRYITVVAWDNFRWLISKCCGARFADCCLSSRTPAVQVLYVALVLAGTYLYLAHIRPHLPYSSIPAWHNTLCMLLPGVLLLAFWNASFSNPGYISREDVQHHLQMYSYDEATCTPKDCWTCHFQRPARSKHCPACDRCVARFDHHCIWINNCVGMYNLKDFLLFLTANVATCAYGTWLVSVFVWGDVRRRGALSQPFWDEDAGKAVTLKQRPLMLLRWLLTYYRGEVTLLFMLASCGTVLAFFLAHHLYLVARNVTTYETFAWRHLSALVKDLQQTEYLTALVDEVDTAGTAVPAAATRDVQHSEALPGEEEGMRGDVLDGSDVSQTDDIIQADDASLKTDDIIQADEGSEGDDDSQAGGERWNDSIGIDESRSYGPSVHSGVDGTAEQRMYRILAEDGELVFWRGWRRMKRRGRKFALPPNQYYQGVLQNFAEVLFPLGFFKARLARSKMKGE